MEIFVLKAITVIALVLSLTVIAEKVSPKLSGILSGLPLGSSITLIFFAIEYGVNYVKETALYNIHGVFAALAFSIGYYISTFYSGKFEIILSLIISFISYLIIAFILSFIPPHVIFTPLIIFTLLIISAIYFSKKEDHKIVKISKVSIYDLAIRSILTLIIFLIISNLPKYVPASIAGIFSSFPTILLPLLLIIHFNHSNLQARTIIKNTPFGLTSVIIYSYVVYFAYPTIGVVWGTIVGLCSSALLIFIQTKVFKYFKFI
ncbi:conserved hypothetical protein [Arcobacter nitrofigilis DSM 7299]|uniref:Uncharacterized protein n=1 Tax=Arcobacter nitrofigilis (strain ATCC 33309 / DSM 7299 / CCUG 15893 / LMG 7604 / NCTC 12251 / CI) TaxID=572480 RepID=D5V6H8_ARCNC|nr:hypothetical protein [Arcobacter nitrofigilis]ADG94248.1 conserved hypothetical protein [Arcobacter nitrofigilis DSM 7299]